MNEMNERFVGLAHIAVMTNDLEASIAFYELLGGEVLDTAAVPTPQGDKRLVLMDVANLVLELIAPPVPMDLQEGVVSHFAVYVDDLDKTVAALRAAGVDAARFTEKKELDIFGGICNCFLTGPSGERIELMEYVD